MMDQGAGGDRRVGDDRSSALGENGNPLWPPASFYLRASDRAMGGGDPLSLRSGPEAKQITSHLLQYGQTSL
jgi:hypothetical protein